MEDLEPGKDNSIFPSSTLNQAGIGGLEVRCMAFTSDYPSPHIRFAHEITIWDAKKKPPLYGEKIFQGGLEDLINLINGRKEVTDDEGSIGE